MFAAGVLGSFVLYLVIGAVMGRKVKDRSDFYVAGRKAPTVLVAGTLVASFLSTVSFMGEVGFSYDGFPAVMLIVTALNISGYVLGVLLFGRYLRRAEALTVPEFFGKRFDSKAVQSVAGVMVVLGIGLYLVAVTQGLSLVVAELLGWPMWVTVVIVWLAYSAFTLMSGSQGILVNDTVMFFVFMLAGVVGMGWVIGKAGGPVEAVTKMAALESKPDALSWHGVTGDGAYMGSPGEVLVWAVTIGIVWMGVVAISPWQSSRYLMAKDEHVCLRSGFVAMASVGLLYVFLMFGAFAINLFNPNVQPSEVAFIWAAQNVLPPALGMLAVTGIVAAGLSSAAAFLALIGFSAAHDVFAWRRQPSGKQAGSEDSGRDETDALRFSRLVMFSGGVVVLGLTLWSPPAVLEIGYFAATLFAASWGPAAIWGIRSARLTARGALCGMVAGFVGVAVLNGLTTFGGLDLPAWADPAIVGFALSIGATIVGNLGAQPSPRAVAFRDSILATPGRECSAAQLSRTRLAMLGTVAVFAVTLIGLVALYGLPFGDAVTAGGGL